MISWIRSRSSNEFFLSLFGHQQCTPTERNDWTAWDRFRYNFYLLLAQSTRLWLALLEHQHLRQFFIRFAYSTRVRVDNSEKRRKKIFQWNYVSWFWIFPVRTTIESSKEEAITWRDQVWNQINLFKLSTSYRSCKTLFFFGLIDDIFSLRNLNFFGGSKDSPEKKIVDF